MLDAIAQTLAEHAVKPVAPANVHLTQATLVVPQQTVVPVLKPIVSAPESLSPSFSRSTSFSQATFVSQSNSQAKQSAGTVQPTAVKSSSQTDTVTAPPAKTSSVKAAQFLPTKSNQVAATEQNIIKQRLVLKQRLAEIVAREQPLKEVTTRANLEATAIAAAQEGQFAQAREMAHDAMLSPESQAMLLAQIDAIEAQQLTKPAITHRQAVPKAPAKSLAVKSLATKSLAATLKAWVPTTVPGRSLPSPLQYMPAPSSLYSYVPPSEPKYVHYALNGFGRAIGGIGVVVDDNTPDFNGQNWTAAYAPGGFNAAELWKGLSFIFPLAVPAPITSGFGWRVHPIRGDRRFHSGTDLGAPMGTPVLAAADGKVALSDWLNGYGLAIILSHNDNTRETLYGHLSQVFVKPGQWVEKGTVIGRVGSTGLSTGPHLHFELRQMTPHGWQAIDPGVQLKSALARLVKAMREG